MCSKIAIKTFLTLCRSAVFVVNFEHTSHLLPIVSIVDFEQVNTSLEERRLYFRRSAQNLEEAKIYLFKVNKRNNRKRCEICSNSPERRVVLVF